MVKLKPEQIRSWVLANFPEARTRKSGLELVIHNPFDGDTGRHFNISLVKGTCHDWRGDSWAGTRKPSFLWFVQQYKRCNFVQAVKEVTGDARALLVRVKHQEEPVKPAAQLELPPGSYKLLESPYKKMAADLRGWLHSRGIFDDKIAQYDIRHSGPDVIWPYYEYDELVYWQSRNFASKVFRFPSDSVGVTKGMFLYGFDYVEPSSYLAVTEAIIDMITVGGQMLASGGAVLTPMQVRKLKALNPQQGVILAPDNDPAGIKSLAANFRLLEPYFRMFHAVPPKIPYSLDGVQAHTKDWNDLGKYGPGWDKVLSIFESRVKPFRQVDLLHFVDGEYVE